MEAIKTVGLTKKYGALTAVDGLNLSVEQGEFYALLGVNGAGKTTAVRMLSCLCAPSAGEAYLMGKSVTADPAAVKRIIGVSPQDTAVAPNCSVRENLELMGGAHGFDRRTRVETARRLMEQFGLEEIAARRAGKLSGGWQRRLSIAMALVGEVEILFLDEPTLGLDVLARRELWREIEKLKGRVTVVLTTHYLEEAEALSDRIGIMKNGRLLAQGTSAELERLSGRERFEDAFVAIVEGDCQ